MAQGSDIRQMTNLFLMTQQHVCEVVYRLSDQMKLNSDLQFMNLNYSQA